MNRQCEKKRSSIFQLAVASCPRGHHAPRRGFTLIELLVVIAIIAILAAMLLPGLAKAKAKAKMARCLSNEKEIGLAYLMYADDHAEFLPLAGDPAGISAGRWFLEISPYLANRDSSLTNLVAKGKVVACPAAQLENAIPASVPGSEAYGGYGHNFFYLGNYAEDDRQKLSSITKPAETCMNGDCLDPGPGLFWWNLGFLYPPSNAPWGSTGGVRPYIRHGNGSNYSWADGHVSLSSWRFMSTGANRKIDWYYMKTPIDPGRGI